MENKVVYETKWVARDKSREYPHGWGFDAPLVEFAQDVDVAIVGKICREELSNAEFECIGVIPRKCLRIHI